MINIEDIIKKAKQNGKKIEMSEILKLDLSEEKFEELVYALEEAEITIEEKKEENSLDCFNDDIVKAYFKEIAKTKLLTQAEEKELFEKIAVGDEKAKQKMIESNLRLVASIAKRYQNKNMSLIDLIQEGNIGLIRAVEKFDITRGCKFSTYATWWIRQAVTRSIAEKSRLIRIPVNLIEIIKKINVIEKSYLQEKGVKLTSNQIAKILNLSEEEVEYLRYASQETISLNLTLKEDNETPLMDMIPDEKNIEDDVFSKIDSERLCDLITKVLTEREATVITYRYGIGLERSYTLKEVSKKFGVSRQRISQIEYKALRRLRIILKRSSTFSDYFTKNYQKGLY